MKIAEIVGDDVAVYSMSKQSLGRLSSFAPNGDRFVTITSNGQKEEGAQHSVFYKEPIHALGHLENAVEEFLSGRKVVFVRSDVEVLPHQLGYVAACRIAAQHFDMAQ